jgi:pyruvate decarboxylase
LVSIRGSRPAESNLNKDKAIVGAGGGLGSLACQYAKALGYRVLAISSGEEKHRLCIDQLGAKYFVDYRRSKDIVSEVRSIAPDGPHAVVVVASAMEPFQAALQVQKPQPFLMDVQPS